MFLSHSVTAVDVVEAQVEVGVWSDVSVVISDVYSTLHLWHLGDAPSSRETYNPAILG